MPSPSISGSLPSLNSHSNNAAHISFSHHCHERSLIQLSSVTSFTAQCFSCTAVDSRRACRWVGVCRASMELGQALPSTSLVSETPSPSTSGITWAQTALQGPRSEMEDAIVVRSDGLKGFTYAAVLDGHAGFFSVSFLRDELFKECIAASENGSLLQTNDLSRIQSVVTDAFLQTDNRLLSWLEETGEDFESGSTATVMFLGADSLIVAHVGDSRVVISRGGKAEVICGDHRPYGKSITALSEIKRIRQAGGWISNGRVCGVLSVSRAFGDIKLKSLRQEMLEEGVKARLWTSKFASKVELTGDWVTAVPDVSQATLEDAEFIILASDGLWDYIQSSEAVRFLRNQLRRHGDAQRACEALAKMALDRNGQDNVSVVIADFGKVLCEPNAPLEDSNVVQEVGQLALILGVVGLGIWLSQFASHGGLF